jgi:hypothetical protein
MTRKVSIPGLVMAQWAGSPEEFVEIVAENMLEGVEFRRGAIVTKTWDLSSDRLTLELTHDLGPKLRWWTNGHVVEWDRDMWGVWQGSLTIALQHWSPKWLWFRYSKPFHDAHVHSFWALWLHVCVLLP